MDLKRMKLRNLKVPNPSRRSHTTTALRMHCSTNTEDGTDALVNLRCLQDVSGWEIKKVDGTNVKMSFRNEIDVSFNMNQLSQGNSATIEPPSNIDPMQQFMFSSLTPQLLKGDIKTVTPHLT